MCLMYVEVSFYNVARSLTICFNVVLSYLLLGSKTSPKTMSALVLVIMGFYIGSEGEVNFSLIGTVFGVISSVFVCLNSIYTKKVLPHVGEDKWVLAFYNNVNASLIFIPCMWFSGEFAVLAEHMQTLFSLTFWFGMVLSGVLGFSIGIVVVMQIKATTPLTHNVSGTAKACAQTMLAFVLWGNDMTAGAVMGVALVLGGSLLYAYIRITEENANKASKAAHPEPLDLEQQQQQQQSE
ncbi:GDP-fucose transporter [Thecamonas trahens ATCC 50062]|uniref:GDP-fucose transporter n=1 Tax=Thecamonas trahens ATCC 50062 TaxID=461836 RepID=A0A0L0DIM2_THETB|nr:GDP-fucose transporter [Thecamonas trahens ATCC 50062]KNC51178.1 GDP-fucose transporter [Thecamonas trahens ATCC 50062]|eukprot:XP_013756380.1 GDP-fucose transporter [Thecamonas trahens ATCC 50062]